ncbi:uncharacterized protein A4U43_C04F33570 [Asparagus officinalis]|uniref:Peptidase A1 domain-containing protein n=1 Tax=Asparagus officinalis TaxID=4686 RepID=A0A5P1F5H2_ASPOF|nr:uncharacterized protein A4U43_C04F33570 [Asparagus officinalis]
MGRIEIHRPPGGWPEREQQVADYYGRRAAGHDRGRRRLLDGGDQELTFSDGNATVRVNSLGFLHYAVVALGTPNVTFMVALDTGSDLFWVPCDCVSCAPTSSGTNGFDFDFSIYSPNMSSTSQGIPCSSNLCERHRCSKDSSQCTYNVEYVSDDTSSTGVLIKDLLYLTTEDTSSKVVKTPIVFGCGMIQTGSFLDAAAPNGLFGLGMDKLSVPSTLSSSGITSNSFSMCFGRDGLGRINFGDNGSSDQEETPINTRNLHPTYNISLTGIGVRNISMEVGFSALVDSGTSFTYLADPAYSSLAKSFNSQVHDKPFTADSDIPFEYCYQISSNESMVQLPDISFTAKGGSHFPINDPIVLISNEKKRQFIYCLAVIKSTQLNIIGQNFLTGLRVVFDRDRMIVGWKKFDCYKVEDSNPLPVNPRNSSATPPSIAFSPSSYTPEATKGKGHNGTEASVLTPGAASSHSSLVNTLASTILLLLLLPLSII